MKIKIKKIKYFFFINKDKKFTVQFYILNELYLEVMFKKILKVKKKK